MKILTTNKTGNDIIDARNSLGIFIDVIIFSELFRVEIVSPKATTNSGLINNLKTRDHKMILTLTLI